MNIGKQRTLLWLGLEVASRKAISYCVEICHQADAGAYGESGGTVCQPLNETGEAIYPERNEDRKYMCSSGSSAANRPGTALRGSGADHS